MSRPVRLLGGGLLLALVVAQFIPVDRSNPPETGMIDVPHEVHAVLERACFDCHSHRTVWPWYSYVAPVSWMVAHDVEEGRAEMNFSRWTDVPAERRARLAHEIWEEVEEGNMPPRKYRVAHPAAKLSSEELSALRAWSQSAGSRNGDGK
jgi:hypothetical protein